MRTNITNNLIPNNYFIRRKKPIYIDSTNKVYIKKFGNDCTNLEIVYKNQTNTFINQNIKEIDLTESDDIEIDGIIFNSEIKYTGRIIPSYYYNIGRWITINNNYQCNLINDVIVDYPVKLMGPNLILINNDDYVLTFTIEDPTIFNNNETFTVNLIPINYNVKQIFTLPPLSFDKTIQKYTIKFSSSIFLNPVYPFLDNKYYIALQSTFTNIIYLSNPSRYTFITKNSIFNDVVFQANNKNLNYSVVSDSEFLLHYKVSGLEENSIYHLKINDLHDKVPVYYSPPITFNKNNNIQSIYLPIEINKHNYNVELETVYGDIMDLGSQINIGINYKYKVHILNAASFNNLTKTQSFTLNLCFDQKFINTVVNISLENYFIMNTIITNDNYLNYSVPITLNDAFDSDPNTRYHIRVQLRDDDRFCAISDEYVVINNTKSLGFTSLIMPNFGYNSISFQYSNTFNPIKLSGNYICPYGVNNIDVNMIYNGNQVTGQIVLKANSIIGVTESNLLINGRELINFITGNFVINRIINYVNQPTNLSNNLLIKYNCETGYIIQLNNWDKNITNINVYTGNNSNGIDLILDGSYSVNYSTVYGYYIKLDKVYFNFVGELHYYWNNNNSTYLGKITITDYPINFSISLSSNQNNIINMNSKVLGSIIIGNYNNNFPVINSYNLYFVDDIYGNNPTYLTTITNTLNFSFVYFTQLQIACTKYIMIKGNNNNFIINKVINLPFTIELPLTSNQVIIGSNVRPSKKMALTNLSAAVAQTIIGVYTTFDTPPNKTTPSNFLQTYALYKYNNVSTLLGTAYKNFNGYLILQCDSLSNGVSQTNITLDNFVTFIISQLANKKINLINVPSIFQNKYTTDNFVTESHTFEYYRNTIYNNTQINIQTSLCSNVIQNNQLITDITIIKKNFLQSYDNEVRNYTGQNSLNEQIAQVTSLTNNAPRFAWIENLGQYISQYYQLSINNVEIEKITSDWINIWNEINIKPGHRSGYNKMIGNIPALTEFSPAVLSNTQIKIPLPFYFNRYNNAGLSIPLISLLHSDVKMTLQLEQLQNLIISDPLTKFVTSGRPKLSLQLKYIYLDSEERRKFATSKHEYLIEQENYRNYSHYGTNFETKINFMQPVKDLFWYAQPKANTSNINSKQYYNYTTSKFYQLLSNYDRYDEVNPITQLSKQRYASLYKAYPNVPYIPMYINNQLSKSDIPFTTKSPINNSQLRLNGQSRFDEVSDLTQLIHFHKYNNIPQNGVHTYPFCLYPNEYQPSGSCNFSQLADAYFLLDTDDGAYNVGIIARNYNLLRIMGGQAGLAFEL